MSLIIVAVIAFSLLSTFWTFSYLRRIAERRQETGRELAGSLGLRYVDKDEAFRIAMEERGQGAMYETMRRMPPALLGFVNKFDSTWRLEGTREGVRVAVYLEARSSGKNSTTYYTVVRAYHPRSLDFKLEVAREGIFTKLGKALFGMQDIEIGDAEFDEKLRVKTEDPERARRLLSKSELRVPIMAATRLEGTFRLTGVFAHWERMKIIGDPAEMSSVLGALVPIARAMGEH